MIFEIGSESEFNSNQEEWCLGESVQVLVQIARHLCLTHSWESENVTQKNKTKQVVT